MQVNCELNTFTRACHVIDATAIFSQLRFARNSVQALRLDLHGLRSAHQLFWFEPSVHHASLKEGATA